MKKVFLLLVCFIFAAFGAAASQDSAAKSDAPAKEDVMRLLDLMKVKERMVQMTAGLQKGMETGAEAGFKQKVPDPTPAQLKRLHLVTDTIFKDFPIDEMIDAMVPIYQRHLSKSDLDAVVAFYSSPVGQRLLNEQPAMMAESMKVGQDIMLKKLPDINRRLDEEVTKLATEESEKKMSGHSLDK